MRWLKPVSTWPAFAGEIAIIVIGVLIALSAEEVVQRLNWKKQVSEARGALDSQLVESKFAALERISQSDCTARQLDRVDDLIAKNSIPEVDLSDLGSLRLWGTSTWESASASGAVAHMTPEVRDIYAGLFSFTAVIGAMNREEFDTIADLRTMERHRTLTETSTDRLSRDVSRLRSYNRILTLAARQWLDGAEPLRLQLSEDALRELEKPRRCALPDERAAT